MHLRFAPALSSGIHIGNLMVAMINHVIAKQQGKQLMLRIDKESSIDEATEKELTKQIVQELSYFNIVFDKVIIQRERQAIYSRVMRLLLEQEYATRANNVIYILIRDFLKKHNIKKITIDDSVYRKMTRLASTLKNVIIYDVNNNMFMYTFTSCVDDILTSVSYIIRGSDHIDNSFTQQIIKMIIRRVINYTPNHEIKMAHLPLYKSTDNKKISKSDQKYNQFKVAELINNNITKETVYYYVFSNQTSHKSFNIYNLYSYQIKQIGTKPKRVSMESIIKINNYFTNKTHPNLN